MTEEAKSLDESLYKWHWNHIMYFTGGKMLKKAASVSAVLIKELKLVLSPDVWAVIHINC